MPVGAVWDLGVSFYPEEAQATVRLFSTNPAVLAVEEGRLKALAPGQAEIGVVVSGCHSRKLRVSVVSAEDYVPQTYREKCLLVFGEYVYDPRDVLSGGGSYLTQVTIPAWDFGDSSRSWKTTRYYTISVHKSIAHLVKKIFEEIYNGPEQFPISAVGGYYEGGHSEHTPGLAIDINPWSNAMIDGDTVMAGDHWTPGEDPYSIPLGGDVDRAFEHYGFSRGFWGWRSDYMHYSFFGT